MSEMLEKVMEVICDCFCEAREGGGDDPSLEAIARAAIEAMRKPTEEMKDAAMAKWGSEPLVSPITRRCRAETYTAMIDAALSRPQDPPHPL